MESIDKIHGTYEKKIAEAAKAQTATTLLGIQRLMATDTEQAVAAAV